MKSPQKREIPILGKPHGKASDDVLAFIADAFTYQVATLLLFLTHALHAIGIIRFTCQKLDQLRGSAHSKSFLDENWGKRKEVSKRSNTQNWVKGSHKSHKGYNGRQRRLNDQDFPLADGSMRGEVKENRKGGA